MKKDRKEILVKMWESRIEEIERTGNCPNSNIHKPEKYFSEKYNKEEMVKYCRNKIEFIEKL